MKACKEWKAVKRRYLKIVSSHAYQITTIAKYYYPMNTSYVGVCQIV
jgi:hypothetical protein